MGSTLQIIPAGNMPTYTKVSILAHNVYFNFYKLLLNNFYVVEVSEWRKTGNMQPSTN